MAKYTRFITFGDSMTEGMCDDIVDGQYRGWADRVADVLAKDNPGFSYFGYPASRFPYRYTWIINS